MDALRILAFIILLIMIVGPILLVGLAIFSLDVAFGSGNSLAPWGVFAVGGLVTFGLYKLFF